MGIRLAVLATDEDAVVGVAEEAVDGVGGAQHVVINLEGLNQLAGAVIVGEEGDVAFVVTALEDIGEDGEGILAAGGDAGGE